METNNLMEWARKEVALLIDSEERNEDMSQATMCALHAYDEYLKEIGKVKNPNDLTLTKTIFLQLFNGDPLTPIEDNEEDWSIIDGYDPTARINNCGFSVYQCKRRHTLLKRVTYNKKTGEIGEIKFNDSARSTCIDIGSNKAYSGGLGEWLLDQIMPISMPYFPTGKIKIFTEEFKAYPDGEDSDTCGVLYFRMPDGQMNEIKRFFKRDAQSGEAIEINFNEYAARKRIAESKNP